jgi:hypothetical protein
VLKFLEELLINFSRIWTKKETEQSEQFVEDEMLKLSALNDIAEAIVLAIEENGVLDG